jgi:hypothetical protein
MKLCAALCVLLALQAPQPGAPQKPVEPNVTLRFAGLLPGSVDPKLAGEFTVDFGIYLSPRGGEPAWKETHKVEVENGRIDVPLGNVKRIPLELHETTFKFLGVSVNGGPEVYPRLSIVNVVYVTPADALAEVEAGKKAAKEKPLESRAHPSAVLADESEKATTWKNALIAARAKKGDLPDHEDWYRALRSMSEDAARARAGHYEWVLPWAYDPASKDPDQRMFHARPEGTDSVDLSATNAYVWRIAQPPATKAR